MSRNPFPFFRGALIALSVSLAFWALMAGAYLAGEAWVQ